MARSAAELDAVDAAYDRLAVDRTDQAGDAFRLEVAERLESQHRIEPRPVRSDVR